MQPARMPAAHIDYWLELLQRLQAEIRDRVRASMARQPLEAAAQVAAETSGDVIFAIDKVSEEVIFRFFREHGDPEIPFVLIAEGITDSGVAVFPAETPPEEALYRVILDPIDGTRCIMFDKRSAWALTGVAPNQDSGTSLADIELAMQTEIPVAKQAFADVCWAVKGHGAEARRIDLSAGTQKPLQLQPSQADTIEQGYASFLRICPGSRQLLGLLEEQLADRLFVGGNHEGRCLYFEDQYISTGGQLYELMSGHDRFIADLRALLAPVVRAQRGWAGLCCHPYDLCTQLIACEAGVVITNAKGAPLQAPLDTTSNVSWIGYANPKIQRQVEPTLQELLRKPPFSTPG